MSRNVITAPSRGQSGRSPAENVSRIAFSSSGSNVAWSLTSVDAEDDFPELSRGLEPLEGGDALLQRPHAIHGRDQATGAQLGDDGIELRMIPHRRPQQTPLIPEESARVRFHHGPRRRAARDEATAFTERLE